MSKAPAVDYALEIIEFMASRNSDTGIADISNTLNINKNAVSRVLEALLEKNWIYLSDTVQKKYRLTLRPFSMVSKNVGNNELVKIASPLLKELNDNLEDAVYLGVEHGRNVLYLLHYDSVKPVRINGRVGGEYPMNCSAPGKVIISNGEREKFEAFFAHGAEKRTPNTITEEKAFTKEAEKIRKLGYALDNEEFAPGIVCIAVPVYDCDGKVVASVGVSSLTLYDTIDTLINKKLPLLNECAKKISVALGYNG